MEPPLSAVQMMEQKEKMNAGPSQITKVVPKVKKVQLMVQIQRLVLLWWRRLLRWQRRWRLRLPCKLLSWS
jgi:hypothetical protein